MSKVYNYSFDYSYVNSQDIEGTFEYYEFFASLYVIINQSLVRDRVSVTILL